MRSTPPGSSTPSTPTSPTSPTHLADFDPGEVFAGLLAKALPFLAEHGLEHPSLDEVLERSGVRAERAAEAAAAFLEQGGRTSAL